MAECWQHGNNPWPPSHDTGRCDYEYVAGLLDEIAELQDKIDEAGGFIAFLELALARASQGASPSGLAQEDASRTVRTVGPPNLVVLGPSRNGDRPVSLPVSSSLLH